MDGPLHKKSGFFLDFLFWTKISKKNPDFLCSKNGKNILIKPLEKNPKKISRIFSVYFLMDVALVMLNKMPIKFCDFCFMLRSFEHYVYVQS